MTLEQLSHETFYKMGNYSQLVIDLVQDIEQDVEEMTETEKQAKVYFMQNIKAVIDTSRVWDLQALEALIKILE